MVCWVAVVVLGRLGPFERGGLSDLAWEHCGGKADTGCPWAVDIGCGSVVGMVVVR